MLRLLQFDYFIKLSTICIYFPISSTGFWNHIVHKVITSNLTVFIVYFPIVHQILWDVCVILPKYWLFYFILFYFSLFYILDLYHAEILSMFNHQQTLAYPVTCHIYIYHISYSSILSQSFLSKPFHVSPTLCDCDHSGSQDSFISCCVHFLL